MNQPAQPAAVGSGSSPGISSAAIYHEACESMRATDEISLKLLAAVPLVTGVGIALLVREPSKDFPGAVRLVLGLFTAVVTFAIYQWELRNSRNCEHLRDWVFAFEHEALVAQPGTAGPHDYGSKPRFLFIGWGKTEAEHLLYWTVIVSWLAAGGYSLIP